MTKSTELKQGVQYRALRDVQLGPETLLKAGTRFRVVPDDTPPFAGGFGRSVMFALLDSGGRVLVSRMLLASLDMSDLFEEEVPATATVRSKFTCVSKTEYAYGSFELRFEPVRRDNTPENRRFWDATPNGSLTLSGVKREVADLYTVGSDYYLDMTPAPRLRFPLPSVVAGQHRS